jgi:phage/plasmid-associated DNA primase
VNYKKYQKEGLIATPGILKFTNLYQDENDPYKKFWDEKTEVATTHIHTSTLYEHFKRWYATNNPHTRIPSSKAFVAALRNYTEVHASVKVDCKTSTGIKLRQLTNNINNDSQSEDISHE